MLAAAGHEYRFAIIYLLAHKPMTGEQLLRILKIRGNLFLHHIAVLRKAEIITCMKEGKHQRYSLKEKTFRNFPGIAADTPFWKDLTNA